MEPQWQRRVEALEEEVSLLRQEIAVLKQVTQQAEHSAIKKGEKMKEPVEMIKKDSGLHRKNFELPRLANHEKATEREVPSKPKRTFEEQFVAVLPKVFMFIFVLGVLWGLKLISDYGMLTDGMKIVLAYIASVGLAGLALFLERKKKSNRAMHTALYGGSFAVGVLATAAAVLIYGVMSTMFALFIALAYIVYGIFLCYWKGSEGLTIFVMFTSLLLPYLLEYMEFDSLLVIGFVVVLFIAIQIVLKKHRQWIALYFTALFTGLSTLILYVMGDGGSWVYPFGWLLIIMTFFGGWIVTKEGRKWPKIQEGLLYSFGVLGITFLHVFSGSNTEKMMLFALATALITVIAFWMKRLGERNLTDIFAAVAIVSVVNGLLVSDLNNDWRTIIILTTAAIGILLGIRIQAPVMKITNTAILAFTTLFIYVGYEVAEPLEISMHLLAIVYFMAAIYSSEKAMAESFLSVWLKKIYWGEVTRIATFWLIVLFISKMDTLYISESYTLYFTISFIALSCAAALVMPRRIVGLALPILLFGIMTLCTLIVWMSISTYDGILLQLAMHLIYIGVWGALIVDFYYKGAIYTRYEKNLQPRFEQLLIVGWLIMLVNLWNMAYFISEIGYLPEFLYVIFATCLLFAFASGFILSGRMQKMQLMMKAGFVLLILAIGKLIFFDLSSLDLLVRAIVFLVIGAIGLLLSNRLLKKE